MWKSLVEVFGQSSFEPVLRRKILKLYESKPVNEFSVQEMQSDESLVIDLESVQEVESCYEMSSLAYVDARKEKLPRRFEGFCYLCHERGHKRHQCKWRSKYCSNESRRNDEFVWILDTGATSHQTNCENYFNEESELKPPVVINVAKKGEQMKAEKCGNIAAKSNCSGDSCQILLMDVLDVPELTQNLLSVQEMVKAGLQVKFVSVGERALIILERKIIGIAYNRNGLYEWSRKGSTKVFKFFKRRSSRIKNRSEGESVKCRDAKEIKKSVNIFESKVVRYEGEDYYDVNDLEVEWLKSNTTNKSWSWFW